MPLLCDHFSARLNDIKYIPVDVRTGAAARGLWAKELLEKPAHAGAEGAGGQTP